MRRKLPKLLGDGYPGEGVSEGRELQFAAYAAVGDGRGVDPSIENTAGPLLVCLERVATHEVPGTKWVEFRILPEAIAITGERIHAHPEMVVDQVRCEWSDFLRLTRWIKDIAHLPAGERARIASLRKTYNSHVNWQLSAVDHPVRYTVRN
jgi:hypothetical protein